MVCSQSVHPVMLLVLGRCWGKKKTIYICTDVHTDAVFTALNRKYAVACGFVLFYKNTTLGENQT